MENEGTIAIPIIGYIIALISPIIGLLYGAALVFFKKETPLYQKHGRFIIYFAILVFIISFIIRMAIR
ncbi:hypothetical protein [Methanobrevibacter sp.]|uniref:hypothetical protein n=1 Tax=Methanobrevibacter sp. TaxID=66852 RepID=UPI0025F8E889|nr:hypothetical protein [uncultured Methanobrevibacter sp.]